MNKEIKSLNLWWGCSGVNDSCSNCSARDTSKRFLGQDIWGDNNPRRAIKTAFADLKKFNKRAKANGKRETVFVGSMMDIFEKPQPIINLSGEKVYSDLLQTVESNTGTLRNDLFKEITLGKFDNLIFLFLTKRPTNIKKMIPKEWVIKGVPENVYFGTSVSDQKTAEKLIPQLVRSTPEDSKLFISVEPQLSEITLFNIEGISWLKWVIQGGESGLNRRPFAVEWAYKMQTECESLSIPYFFKQIDKVQKPPEDLKREYPADFN